MKKNTSLESSATGRSDAGMTLLEVIAAVAIAALAGGILYSSFGLANAMIMSNRQKLEAEALAMDTIMEVFNTYNFTGAVMAVTLPPKATPTNSLLPTNSEIRVMITPNIGVTPYQWDIEVRVKRDRYWPGRRMATLTNDAVYRVTRYKIGRNG